jgi:RNA polymerase sigma-70 factor (ECF subfamily)
MARRLDEQPAAAALADGGVAAPPASSDSGLTPDCRRMLQAIDSLPEDEREVFDLIRIQGLTYAEAAAVIETSVATVQRRLSRGRLRLAQQLADLLPGPSGGPFEPPGDSPGPKPGPPYRRSPSGETLGLPGDTLPP